MFHVRISFQFQTSSLMIKQLNKGWSVLFPLENIKEDIEKKNYQFPVHWIASQGDTSDRKGSNRKYIPIPILFCIYIHINLRTHAYMERRNNWNLYPKSFTKAANGFSEKFSYVLWMQGRKVFIMYSYV